MEREAVTTAAGVPTIWTGLLAYLRETGARLTHTRRLLVAGSAVPTSLIRAFRDEYDVTLQPAWGMTETNPAGRSEEHTSELQSLMRISYAVFCLKKKKTI